MRRAKKIAKCLSPRRNRCAARQLAAEPVWYRLRTKDWEFFVSSEVEAFSVLARHDVDDVHRITAR